jgi:hypothetical protein
MQAQNSKYCNLLKVMEGLKQINEGRVSISNINWTRHFDLCKLSICRQLSKAGAGDLGYCGLPNSR